MPSAILERPETDTSQRRDTFLRWVGFALPLLFLWAILIRQLAVEWSINAQYSYGWVVPILMLGMLGRRRDSGRGTRDSGPKARDAGLPTQDSGPPSAVHRPPSSDRCPPSSVFRLPSSALPVLFALTAFLYLPARMIHEAVPFLRPAHWLLALVVVAITLIAVYLVGGRERVRQAAFPICFILVAVPWVYTFEKSVIQRLALLDARVTMEVVGWFGIPSILHGKVIEIGSGLVGINDACSGIRSFQSTLMGALFLGELYRLTVFRRAVLCLAGFVLAFGLNVARTSMLVCIASSKGVSAIDAWHDPAGISITLTCMAGLWGVARGFGRKQTTEIRKQRAESRKRTEDRGQRTGVPSLESGVLSPIMSWSALRVCASALSVWIIAVEVVTAMHFRSGENGIAPAGDWTIKWPSDNPTLTNGPLNAVTLKVLRCDKVVHAQWSGPEGAQWQAFLLEWYQGKLSSYFAGRHRPEVCLRNAGFEIVSGPEPSTISVHNRELPFNRYVFRNGRSTVLVFHCIWPAAEERVPKTEDGAQKTEDGVHRTVERGQRTAFDLFRGKPVPRKELGRQVIEIAVSGISDVREAEAALARELERVLARWRGGAGLSCQDAGLSCGTQDSFAWTQDSGLGAEDGER